MGNSATSKPEMQTPEVHSVPPMLLRTIDAGGFFRANANFRATVSIDDAELASKPFLHWIDPANAEEVTAVLEGRQPSCRVLHRTRCGDPLPLDVRIVEESGISIVLARCAEDPVEEDCPDDADDEATVQGTLHTIARIVEYQNPGYKCSILLVADGRFVRGAGPSLPEEYNAAIDGYAVGPTVGSCGTAITGTSP